MRTTAGLNRREALARMGAGGLLAAGLWPGALRAADRQSSGTFRFIAVNDLHYMSPECGAWLTKMVRQMNSHQGVEFCLICGDLTEHGRRDDFAAAREILNTLNFPAFVTIGNHDYLSEKPPVPQKPWFPVFSPKDERVYPALIGKFDRRSYDEFFPRRLNYYFEHQSWQFMGLDTSEGLLYDKTRIQPSTFAWVDAYLPRLNPRKPTVIFTHFPLGPKVQHRPVNADDLLERFKHHNLQAVLSGHWHGYSENKVGATVLTTNRCCALKRGNHDKSTEKGYFLCTAENGKISRSFVEVKPA